MITPAEIEIAAVSTAYLVALYLYAHKALRISNKIIFLYFVLFFGCYAAMLLGAACFGAVIDFDRCPPAFGKICFLLLVNGVGLIIVAVGVAVSVKKQKREK